MRCAGGHSTTQRSLDAHPKPVRIASGILLAYVLYASSCTVPAAATPQLSLLAGPGEAFGTAAAVTILGYYGQAMEPFVTRDGKYLFFNDSNDPSVDTNLHWARRLDDLTFEYAGQVPGVNSQQLDGVPSIDDAGVLYFVSPRNYGATFSTIYRARWHGDVAEIGLVPGVSERVPGVVNFDVEVSADGNELVFVDGEYRRGDVVPRSADFVHAYRQGDGFARDANSRSIFARINTQALEYAASLSRDSTELFFTRADPARGQEPTIWRAQRASVASAFEAPEQVLAASGYVEGPSLSGDGRTLYFHRRGPQGFTIFCIQRSEAPQSRRDDSGGREADEVDGGRDAQRSPEVVEAGSLAQVEHRERHE